MGKQDTERDHNKGGYKRKGFQVGPRLAKGAYQGHIARTKRTLIHKAQVKKQYYKDLKAEGYDVGTGANGSKLGERGLGHGEGRAEDDGGDEEEANSSGVDSERNSELKKASAPPPRIPKGSKQAQPSTTIAPSASRPQKKPRLTEEEIEAIRESKRKERKEWSRKDARGQPKLGNRVEVLLNKIKKSMA